MSYNANSVKGVQDKWGSDLNEESPHYTIENAFRHLSKREEGPFTKSKQFKQYTQYDIDK